MTTQATNPFNDFVFLDATPAERGSFTLATDKALAKLKKFQLPDPTYFILQWIQALVASGAQNIEIRYNHTGLRGEFELELKFDGPGYSRAEIDGLYDHVFQSGRDRKQDRLRELALGWLSACSLPIGQIILESNQVRRSRKPGDRSGAETTQTIDRLDGAETPSLSHRLYVQGKGSYPFEKIITRHCTDVPCQLMYNKHLVSGIGGGGGVPWPNKPFQNGPSKGSLGATYGGSSTSHIAFLRHGVEFVNRSEASLQPPVIVRVTDDTLSKNVSQTDVVKDEAYEEFLGRIRSEMKTLGLELTQKRIPSYQRESLNRFIQSYLKSYIDVRVFRDPKRLELLGEEFANLIKFPLFRVAGSSYVSLQDLKEDYDQKGYLLYSLDERSQLARWDGTLLILEVEEVDVLKKYFSNLSALSWSEVKDLTNRSGRQHLQAARKRPLAAFVDHQVVQGRAQTVSVKVPDAYPTGKAVVVKSGESAGSVLPGVTATLIIETPVTMSDGDLANLRRNISDPAKRLIRRLCSLLKEKSQTQNQSVPRYAELICELLLFVHREGLRRESLIDIIDGLGQLVSGAPLLGLEDGTLASVDDLRTYLEHCDKVYLGGVFLEGVESGALDPMPEAEKLLAEILQPQQVVRTESIRQNLLDNPETIFQIRRQKLMKGLKENPSPAQALKNFATEAERQAQELARLEKEYRDALKGPELFVRPDKERLSALAELTTEEEFVPFDLNAETEPPTPSVETSAPHSNPEPPPSLPTLEEDLAYFRAHLKDFCSTPGAVHVERRENRFTFHLATRWVDKGDAELYLLGADQVQRLAHPLPVEGFLRVAGGERTSGQSLLNEAVEQLVLKTIHSYRAEPMEKHQRKRMRHWLLKSCELYKHWEKSNLNIASGLLEIPLVPCLGERVLSWRQLRTQAQRLGKTLVCRPGLRSLHADPYHEVIELGEDWLPQLLETLQFPPQAVWEGEAPSPDFDLLLGSAWRDLLTVTSGTEANLLRPDVVEKMKDESSFWKRWRAGFLSWDAANGKALVNPSHKIAARLLHQYRSDPQWAGVLACALFSTINRGLDEVEDRHERLFLEGLLSTME